MPYYFQKQLEIQAIDQAKASVQRLGAELNARINKYSHAKLYIWLGDLHIHSAEVNYEDDEGAEIYERLVDTRRQLALALHEIHALEPRVECMILGGDLTDYGLPEEYRALRNILDNKAWSIPTMPLFGNHDSSQIPINPDLVGIWSEVKLSNWPNITDRDEFYYSWEDDHNKFIVLDTKQRTDYKMHERQKIWLQQELESGSKTIIVLCHRHQLPVGNWVDEVSRFRDIEVWRMLDGCARVLGVLSGHVHSPRLWQYRCKLYCTFPSIAYSIGAGTGWGGFVVAEGAIKEVFIKEVAGESYDLVTGFCTQEGQFSFLQPELFQNHPLCNPIYWPWEKIGKNRD